MIMQREYLEDLKEMLRDAPASIFADSKQTKDEILEDSDTLEQLWVVYQKDVEEYGYAPADAFADVLAEVLGISAPECMTEPHTESTLRVETVTGTLLASPSKDPDHPGIWIEQEAAGTTLRKPLLRIELDAKRTDSLGLNVYFATGAAVENAESRNANTDSEMEDEK